MKTKSVFLGILIMMIVFSSMVLANNSNELSESELVAKEGLTYIKENDKLFTGVRKDYYPNGQLKFKIEYSEGKINGVNEAYYQNGQLWYMVYFKNNKKDGIASKYYENGQVKYIREYKNNKIKDGEYKGYFENGQLKYSEHYQNGKLNGKYKEYYADGDLRYKFNYVDGYDKQGFDYQGIHKETGIEYSPDGQLSDKFVVEFDNRNLANIIRWNIKREIDDIKVNELRKIKELYLINDNIDDISNLKYLINLESLDLSYNDLSKEEIVKIIRQLNKLERINVSGNGIDNLSKEDFNKQIYIENIPPLKEEVIEENKYKLIGEFIASGIYFHVERGLESKRADKMILKMFNQDFEVEINNINYMPSRSNYRVFVRFSSLYDPPADWCFLTLSGYCLFEYDAYYGWQLKDYWYDGDEYIAYMEREIIEIEPNGKFYFVENKHSRSFQGHKIYSYEIYEYGNKENVIYSDAPEGEVLAPSYELKDVDGDSVIDLICREYNTYYDEAKDVHIDETKTSIYKFNGYNFTFSSSETNTEEW